jgi:RNase P/RNase MRP subunit POP5
MESFEIISNKEIAHKGIVYNVYSYASHSCGDLKKALRSTFLKIHGNSVMSQIIICQ